MEHVKQNNLFPEEEKPKRDNSFEWEQFARLGEMIGDGLHNEPDGKWISKEYKRLMLLLNPDIKQSLADQRKAKNERIDNQILKLIATRKCTQKDCGGQLYQSRSGSKIMFCSKCKARYKAISSKNK